MSVLSLKNKLVALPLKYGSVGGIAVMVLFLVLYFFGNNPLLITNMVEIFAYVLVLALIMGLFILFALKEFRDVHNNGEFHFWQGMTGGMICYLIISAVSAIFILVMTVIIDPDLTTNYIEARIELMEEKQNAMTERIGEERYLQVKSDIQQTTPSRLAWDDFLKKSFLGLFLTIVISIILRK